MNLQLQAKQKKKKRPNSYFRWYRPVAVVLVLIALASALVLRPHRDQELVEVATFSHESWLRIARWSPDEERIVTTAQDNTIKLWDGGGRLIAEANYSEPVHQVYWNADSTRLVAITDRYAYLWDREGELKSLPYTRPHSIYWNSTGTRFMIRSHENTGTLWDRDGELIGQLDAAIFDGYFQWNNQGNRLMGKETPQVVAVWDDSGQRVATLTHDQPIRALRWNSDGTQILTTEDQIARVWDMNGNRLLSMQHHEPIGDAVWSPNEERILIAGYEDPYPLFIWDAEGNLIIRMLNRSRYPQWSADGEYFIRFPRRNSYEATMQDFYLYDANGELMNTMWHGEEWQLVQVEWHPTENMFLSWGRDSENQEYAVYVWNIHGDVLLTILESTPIRQAMWLPDGSHFVTITDFVVDIWTRDGELVNKMVHAQPVSSVSWNEDATRILTRAQFPSAGVIETALWTSQGDHILTTYSGRDLNRYLGTWTRDFSHVLITSSNYARLAEVGAGDLYFDFAR